MVSPSLTTIAVGGPSAGKRLSGSYGAARYRHPETLSAVPDNIPVMTEMRVSHYREMKLTYRKAGGSQEVFRFWAHCETVKDEFDLLRELANGYRPAHQDDQDF